MAKSKLNASKAQSAQTAKPEAPIASDASKPSTAQWLWRVFNLGWPRGHEEGSNEWGAWNLISEEDALRLASEDANDVYEFVPYIPKTPTQPR